MGPHPILAQVIHHDRCREVAAECFRQQLRDQQRDVRADGAEPRLVLFVRAFTALATARRIRLQRG